MDASPTTQHDFTVISNDCVAQDVWRLRIRSSVARTLEAGQFMNLAVPGDGSHLLRIPLSFKGVDTAVETVELLYAVVGEGTRRLSQMSCGTTSTLVGPCGKGWRLPQEDGRALLVAGGIGLPPVMAAGDLLMEAGHPCDAVVGARTAALLSRADLDEFEAKLSRLGGRLVVCTDDGSAGRAGFTTDAMSDLVACERYVQVCSCGPNVMMAGVARCAAQASMACQVSLERMMGCGFGACSCCNVALATGGYALCCQDGPVFDATEVAW